MSTVIGIARASGAPEELQAPRPAARTSPRDRILAYVLLAPALVLIVAFVIAPLVFVIGLAFFDVNLIAGTTRFVGLDNFASEATHPEFLNSVRNTLLYGLLTVFPSIFLGLLSAVIINSLARGQGFWRTVYFMPVATTLVAMSAVWRWLFRADTGVVDLLLSPLGLRDWLGDPSLALGAVAMVGNWHQIGLVTVLYLAALGTLPRDQYESATLDGAGAWSRFIHVTWPGLGPTTVFAFILCCSSALQAYDVIAAMTQGGPLGATETLTYVIWLRGVNYFDIGRAAVLSIALFALSIVVTMVQRSRALQRLEQAGTR